MRDARRRGLPEPPPPSRPDFDVEPVAARLPDRETEAAAVAAHAAVREAWDEAPETEADPDPPHGDPLVPRPAPPPDPAPAPAPAPPEPPQGDPAEEPPPAAARAGFFARRAERVARRGYFVRRAERSEERAREQRALDRDLPPLPARTAARQPPEPPPRSRTAPPPATPPRGPQPRHRRRRWGRRVIAVLALAIVTGAVVFAVELFQPLHGSGSGTVRITIPQGATAREIGDLLAQRGVVSDGRLFALRAALAGKRGDFDSGGFVLKRDMSYTGAIAALTTSPGTAPTINVTIPEGRSRRETAPLVDQAGVTGDYLAATGHAPPPSLGAPRGTRTLEGFLFPSTYSLPKGHATARELVSAQLDAFRKNFAKVDMSYAKRKNLSRYDVLTIASMIEREAQLPRERRLISAVIYNRLRDDIPLSIDATIRYAVHNWSSPLRVSQLNVDSPYNLRKHTGLPPTPIGSPGLASIEAAANPAHVPYLYYVVKPGGHGAHAFSSTDAQFQRDVRRYNVARARNGGRSPAG